MIPAERQDILTLLAEGIDAVATAGSGVADDTGRGWHRTVVGDWSAGELARHLLGVADRYHEWLDRSEAGDASIPFPAKQTDGRNELEVLDRSHLSGEQALARFTARAEEHLARLAVAAAEDDRWNRRFGFPRGTTTIGHHAAIASAEWHIHAWDLSRGTWEPHDAATLYRSVGAAFNSVNSPIRRFVTWPVVNRIANRRPWPDLLERSGRHASST